MFRVKPKGVGALLYESFELPDYVRGDRNVEVHF